MDWVRVLMPVVPQAALSGTEKDALPFAALACALMGILPNVMVSIPPIRLFLMGLVGA